MKIKNFNIFQYSLHVGLCALNIICLHPQFKFLILFLNKIFKSCFINSSKLFFSWKKSHLWPNLFCKYYIQVYIYVYMYICICLYSIVCQVLIYVYDAFYSFQLNLNWFDFSTIDSRQLQVWVPSRLARSIVNTCAQRINHTNIHMQLCVCVCVAIFVHFCTLK